MKVKYNGTVLTFSGKGVEVREIDVRSFWQTYGSVIDGVFGWLAADDSGELWLYEDKPFRAEGGYSTLYGKRMQLPSALGETIIDKGNAGYPICRDPAANHGDILYCHDNGRLYLVALLSTNDVRLVNLETGNLWSYDSAFCGDYAAFTYYGKWTSDGIVKYGGADEAIAIRGSE